MELGSFRRAAQQLGVSAAAVGQQIRRLEELFGARLLHRTTRRMSITAEGRVLFDRARPLVVELSELGRLFDERDGAVRGHLRVSAPTGIARQHVAPLVARFLRAHPDVTVSLDASDELREVGGDADVAFRVLRPSDSTVVAARLSRLEAVTVASPEYLRRRGTPKRPRDLGAHDVVAYRHPSTGRIAPLSFRTAGREASHAPVGRLIVTDVEAACAAAEAGAGIAQPPSAYVLDALAAGRLVSVLDAHRASPWTLYVCHAGGRAIPRRVRAFVDLARSELGKDAFVVRARSR